jgi:hypothetical protein
MSSPFLMHIVWIEEGDLRQSCQLLYLFIILKNILDEDRPPAGLIQKTFSLLSCHDQHKDQKIPSVKKGKKILLEIRKINFLGLNKRI